MNDTLIHSDLELGRQSLDHTQEKIHEYFWTRKKIYIDEWTTVFLPIPLWRMCATLVLLYMFVYSCDFISTLCTAGSKGICVITLLGSSLYFVWAVWWDEVYAVPPTWSYLKAQRFNPLWILVWISNYTILVGVSLFFCLTILVINYGDLDKLFEWECAK